MLQKNLDLCARYRLASGIQLVLTCSHFADGLNASTGNEIKTFQVCCARLSNSLIRSFKASDQPCYFKLTKFRNQTPLSWHARTAHCCDSFSAPAFTFCLRASEESKASWSGPPSAHNGRSKLSHILAIRRLVVERLVLRNRRMLFCGVIVVARNFAPSHAVNPLCSLVGQLRHAWQPLYFFFD